MEFLKNCTIHNKSYSKNEMPVLQGHQRIIKPRKNNHGDIDVDALHRTDRRNINRRPSFN
jgi:hypothetical protein